MCICIILKVRLQEKGRKYLIGAVLCYFISEYTAIAAFIVWIILFFRDVHFDTEKAFAKYSFEQN